MIPGAKKKDITGIFSLLSLPFITNLHADLASWHYLIQAEICPY